MAIGEGTDRPPYYEYNVIGRAQLETRIADLEASNGVLWERIRHLDNQVEKLCYALDIKTKKIEDGIHKSISL